MRNPSLNEALDYPWRIIVNPEEDGGFRGEVVPNIDLVIHAETREEIEAEWRDALRTHLRAYIDSGKCIPIPFWRVAAPPPVAGQNPPILVESWEPDGAESVA